MRRRRDEIQGVFRGSAAVAAGVVTPHDLRGPRYRRVLHGVYVPSWVPPSHTLLCEAAGIVAPVTAQLTGASAATFRGVSLAGPRDVVHMALPDRSQQQAYTGIRFRRVSGPLEAGEQWRTTRLASPERMAFDLAARSPLPVGVGLLDAVVRGGLVDQARLLAWLDGRRDNNLCTARAAAALIDARAQSQPESQCRVILSGAGLAVEPQYRVGLAGGRVAVLDLAVVAARVGIEYDGVWHAAARAQFESDRRRLNDLAEQGWRVVHVTSELLARPAQLVATVQAALALPQPRYDSLAHT